MLSFLLVLTLLATRIEARRACPSIEAVDGDECPSNANLAPCDTPGLEVGDLCEGDGECGTDDDLNNCEHDGSMAADIYRIVSDAGGEDESDDDEDDDDDGGTCPTIGVVATEDCPSNANLAPCDTPGLEIGDMCEGDGECDTDDDLNNCEHDGSMSADVYILLSGDELDEDCADIEPLPEADCPDDAFLVNCDDTSLSAGDLCEGDGECGTDAALNNCGSADVYRVVGAPSPTGTPTLSRTTDDDESTSRCDDAPTKKWTKKSETCDENRKWIKKNVEKACGNNEDWVADSTCELTCWSLKMAYDGGTDCAPDCGDEATAAWKAEGSTCSGAQSWIRKNKKEVCKKNDDWIAKKTCERTCWELGSKYAYGECYDGPAVAPTLEPTLEPTAEADCCATCARSQALEAELARLRTAMAKRDGDWARRVLAEAA